MYSMFRQKHWSLFVPKRLPQNLANMERLGLIHVDSRKFDRKYENEKKDAIGAKSLSNPAEKMSAYNEKDTKENVTKAEVPANDTVTAKTECEASADDNKSSSSDSTPATVHLDEKSTSNIDNTARDDSSYKGSVNNSDLVMNAVTSIVTSNEVKLLKLSAIKMYKWSRDMVQQHVFENPKVKNYRAELKKKMENHGDKNA